MNLTWQVVLGVLSAVLFVWNAGVAAAAQEGVHVIPEFTFESGATFQNMKVGYVTQGTLNPAKDNAILVTHGTSGNRNSYNIFIGPGKALNTDRYFVVTVDAIGGGNSSSPKDGLGVKFPRYSIRDMVHAQYDLVTKRLGLTGLFALGGPSMGSFQAVEWGIQYPGFPKGLMLIVPSGSFNPVFAPVVDTMVAVMQLDPNWNGGRYTQNPAEGLKRAGMVLFPWLRSDEWLAMLKTQGEYEKELTSLGVAFSNWDATSWMLRYFATRNHDVAKPFGGNLDLALSKITSKALIMPSVSDRTVPPNLARLLYRSIKLATYREIPSIAGHLACCPSDEKSMEYAFISAQIKEFLDGLVK